MKMVCGGGGGGGGDMRLWFWCDLQAKVQPAAMYGGLVVLPGWDCETRRVGGFRLRRVHTFCMCYF